VRGRREKHKEKSSLDGVQSTHKKGPRSQFTENKGRSARGLGFNAVKKHVDRLKRGHNKMPSKKRSKKKKTTVIAVKNREKKGAATDNRA